MNRYRGKTKIDMMAVIRYAAMPQILPRLKDLFQSGFQYIPLFMAIVYRSVRLLPAGHSYTRAENVGQYGIRHVIAEAANNLILDKKNIDQMIVFVMLLVGMVLLFAQFALLMFAVLFQPMAALASPNSYADFFVTPNPDSDIAYMMMDMVFGVPGMFESCVSTAVPCGDIHGNPIGVPPPYENMSVNTLLGPLAPEAFVHFPFPIHQALHQMFQFYSIGLLVIATMIALYFIATIVMETAQTGTAFGKRYNHVWAPVRFVIAFGLLVPLSNGMNSAQYIVLYSAKFGSSFATNGWLYFNDTLSTNYLEGMGELVGSSEVPELITLLQFLDMAKTCGFYNELRHGNADAGEGVLSTEQARIRPYLIGDPYSDNPRIILEPNTPYSQIVEFLQGDNTMILAFGEFDDSQPNQHAQYRGFVRPTCGRLTYTLSDPRMVDMVTPGMERLQRFYIEVVRTYWYHSGPMATRLNYPYEVANLYITSGTGQAYQETRAEILELMRSAHETYTESLDALMNDPSQMDSSMRSAMGASSESVIELMRGSEEWFIPPELVQRGWGGAGIWYNRIAEMNGALTTALLYVPEPQEYPMVSEEVRDYRLANDEEISRFTQFTPERNEQGLLPIQNDELAGARAYDHIYQDWLVSARLANERTPTDSNNIFRAAVVAIFGLQGLYDMVENADVHPLAQLSNLGRGLIESSVRTLGGVFVANIGSALLGSLSREVGQILQSFASFLITFAMIGLTIGFTLFYVIPFLPFIYFFFAVGGWVKGIFEAMVGAPLWALAHIRIDGEGLPGSGAENGYYLIFEIFLRPILIVFGLLASILTFSAMVKTLNMTFDLVVNNLTGFADPEDTTLYDIEFYRGPIDQFFFTIVYAAIVYLMGMSSFKLVDLLPNQILRWMGSSASSFNDDRGDAAEGLTGKTSIGAQQTLQKLEGGLRGLSGQASGLLRQSE